MSEKSECSVSQISQELEDSSSNISGPTASIGGDEQLVSDTAVIGGVFKYEQTESTILERDRVSERLNSGREQFTTEESTPGTTESILLERESSTDKKQLNIGEEKTLPDTAVLEDDSTSETANINVKCESKTVSKLLHSEDERIQSDVAVVEEGLQFENTDSILVDHVSKNDRKQFYNEEELILSDTVALEEGPKSENTDSTLVESDPKSDINVMSNDNNQSIGSTCDMLDVISPLAFNTDDFALSAENAQVSLDVKEIDNVQTVPADGCDLNLKSEKQLAQEELTSDNDNTALFNTPDDETDIDNFVVITTSELEVLAIEEQAHTNEAVSHYGESLDQNSKSDGLEITLTLSCLNAEENTQQELETDKTLIETSREQILNTNLSIDENETNIGKSDQIVQSNASPQSVCEVKNCIRDEDVNNEVLVLAQSLDIKDEGNVELERNIQILDPLGGDAEKQIEILDTEENMHHSSSVGNDDTCDEFEKEDDRMSYKSSESECVGDLPTDDTTQKIAVFVDDILNSVSTAQLDNPNEITSPPALTSLAESEKNTLSAINTLTDNNDSVNPLDEGNLTQKSNQDVESDINNMLTSCTTELQESKDIASINLDQESCQSLITDEKIPDEFLNVNLEPESSNILKPADENITVKNDGEKLGSSSEASHVDSLQPDTTTQRESGAVGLCEQETSQSVFVQEENVCQTEEKHDEDENADSNDTSLSSVESGIESLVSAVKENNDTSETSAIQEDETRDFSNVTNTLMESRSNDLTSQIPESDVAPTLSNAQHTTTTRQTTSDESPGKGNAAANALKLGAIAAAGIGAALAAPILISTLGFEAGGIVAGSIAELLMETANSIG